MEVLLRRITEREGFPSKTNKTKQRTRRPIRQMLPARRSHEKEATVAAEEVALGCAGWGHNYRRVVKGVILRPNRKNMKCNRNGCRKTWTRPSDAREIHKERRANDGGDRRSTALTVAVDSFSPDICPASYQTKRAALSRGDVRCHPPLHQRREGGRPYEYRQ